MITERKDDQIFVEAESFTDKLFEKYYKAFLGDRLGEVENGENIYDEAGRRAGQVSGEVESLDQLIAGG